MLGKAIFLLTFWPADILLAIILGLGGLIIIKTLFLKE